MFGVLLLFVVVVLALYNHKNAPITIQRLIDSAQPIFQQAQLVTGEDRFNFYGQTATIVKITTNVWAKLWFATRGEFAVCFYARNQQGEYFIVKRVGSDAKASIFHLPQPVAKSLLKGLYAAPSSSK
jgi:hypothetical protein